MTTTSVRKGNEAICEFYGVSLESCKMSERAQFETIIESSYTTYKPIKSI